VKLVFMLVLTLACHHQAKLDLHTEEVDKGNSVKTTEDARAETKKQDPTDVDTKTTKSDNAVIIQDADGSSTVAVVPRDKPLVLKRGAKVVGTVPVSQTVVDQSKHLGAVLTEKTGEKKSTETDDRDKVAKVGVKTEDSDDVGFSTKFYLLAGGLLIAVSALGVFLARSKLVRRLLGEPL
jgi:hypothetical protein